MRPRWRLRPLALALFACLAAGCEELRTAGKFKPDGDPAARVEPVGGGTLVVRGYQKSSRVGLISLETGERHVLELEHPSETDPGAFAGPDAHGRYAYFTEAESEIWGAQRHSPSSASPHWLFGRTPVRIVVGELSRPGERVLLSREPEDLLQSLIALAPSSGELAFFVFDFDRSGEPKGLHLEIWDLAGGEPRRFALGRVYLDVRGQHGPGLAWLGDGRHLLFKRDLRVNDTGGRFELDGDWNGHTDSYPVLDEEGNAYGSPGNTSNPWRTGFVLCVLDAQTGEWHDLDQGPYGWPTGSGDELIASDGKQLWLVHAADGASELLRTIEPASLLQARGHNWLEPGLAIVAALGPERLLARCAADEHAALPRVWSRALDARSTDQALQLVCSREERAQPCVPRLSVGYVQLANGKLPADLPWIRRRLSRNGD